MLALSMVGIVRVRVERLFILCQFIPNGVEAVIRMDGIVIRAYSHFPA